MAEEEPRVQKVLAYLESIKKYGLVRPKIIGEAIGENAEIVGQDLHSLKERGLAVAEEEGQWKITPEGTEQVIERQHKEKGKPKAKGEPKTKTKEPLAKEADEVTVPNQADVLRYYGDKLRVGIGRGGKQEGTPLDAVIFFVQQTADLNDLNSVWNALGKMAVPSDVRKRWIELYAQSIPSKEIPAELKEKLEATAEGERMPEPGKPAPLPSRFNVIDGQLYPDPEGEYNWTRALQLATQQRGVPANQASPLAAVVESMKLGPEMSMRQLEIMIPLLNKEPPKQDNTMVVALQQRMEQLADDKHKVEMDSIRAEMRGGQRPAEADQQITQLTQQIEALRESLHQQQIATIQEQNKAMMDKVQNNIVRLQEQITAAAQGKRSEGSLGLLEKTIDAASLQLSGIRGDVKPVIETFFKSLGTGPTPKTAEDKKRITAAGKAAVEKERKAQAMEDSILSE